MSVVKKRRLPDASMKQQIKRQSNESESGITLYQLHELVKRRKREREHEESEIEGNDCIKDNQVMATDNGCEVNNKCPMEVEETGKESRLVDTEPEPDEGGLAVLTQHKTKGRPGPVQYKLPDWVAQYCPIEEDIMANSKPLASFSMHHRVKSNLESMGVSTLFPVQAAVVPELLSGSRGPLLSQVNGVAPSDLCVCAPTGCGKTLAYVVPIVSALASVNTCKIRALVVLPSQDLAVQVKSVFQRVSKGTKVKIGSFCGQRNLDEEIEAVLSPLGSKVDVLVCTPGRLVSHLQQCSLLSLSDMRFLVIDEADRIFEQHYHNWLDNVVAATKRPCLDHSVCALFATSSVPFLFPSLFQALPKLDPTPVSPQTSFHSPPISIRDVLKPKQPLQKLLFSATLSLDPEKLSLLQLHKPKLYSVSPAIGEEVGESVLPSTLSEFILVCKSDHKPLYLLHVLRSLEEDKQVLCFTHSKFSTHRLKLVLQQYGINVDEVSANLSQEARRFTVNKFLAGNTKV